MSHNEFRFTKGSEWRKWDLHLHSPSTSLNNQFEGRTEEEKWGKYFHKLSSLTDIAVLGITDYFSIDGYKKVVDFKNEGNLNNIDLILPNVELRILPITDSNSPINLHIIFSPEIVDELEEKFFSRLINKYRGEEFTCTKKGLINLGKEYNDAPQLDDSAAHKNGIEQFKITVKELNDIFINNKTLVENTLVVVSNNSRDGNSGIQHSSMATIRQEIYRFAHCIFSSNPKDIEYFLGKGTDSPEEIKRKYGNLKPCIHGSDAHCLEKVCNPDRQRYTWIKADPTFEGLKQIIYEPESRVRIQSEKPEKKTSYLVIDKVRFVDSQSNLKFSNQWVDLNQNLCAIIGGKSSGKSLLLYYIAKTIDPEQTEERSKTANLQNYDSKNDSNFNFEVQWGDGEVYHLRNSNSKKRMITYIPQMFINTLAEEKGEQALQDLILKILLQNLECKEDYIKKKDQIKAKNLELENSIITLFSWIEEAIALEKDLKKLGDKKAIENEINRTASLINELKAESGFSDDETKVYNELISEKKSKENKLSSLQNVRINLISFQGDLNKSINQINSDIDAKLSEYNDKFPGNQPVIDLFNKIANNIKEAINTNLKENISSNFSIITDYENRITNVKAEIVSINSQLNPYDTKIKNQDLLQKYQNNITEQSSFLLKIEEQERQIAKIESKINKLKIDIFVCYDELFDIYKSIEDFLSSKKYNKIAPDIELKAVMDFNLQKFKEKFESLFDRRFDLNKMLPSFNADNNFNYSRIEHKQIIQSIFEILFTNSPENLKLKSGKSLKDLIINLLYDYFVIQFDLIQNNDRINDMSPGKRGLVLLKLYLHLSNADYPILIDQPEDNLDNRTIYSELNTFIRDKKSKRQIIIVSHNPNLVVSTDAEQVIVANQDGQQTGRDNKQFQFEFVSGSLENNFITPNEQGILFKKGIREHVCEILEGGKEAFEKREQKYGF